MLIAKYKFDSSLYDLIPEFNSGYTGYTYTDEVDGNIVTRTIECDILPTEMRFGNTYVSGLGATNKSNSLLEVVELDASELISANSMFACCSNVTNVVLNNFNKVLDMHDMFYLCASLISCNSNEWDTSNVISMFAVFSGCINLIEADVSNWDTSKSLDMGALFNNCNNLVSLDVSNFDTSQVTNMNYMFYDCKNLTTLDVSNFDTSQVTNMAYMFYQCNNLTSLDLSKWDTSKVTNMQEMFYECNYLSEVIQTNLVTSALISMNRMFYGCNNLIEINTTNWNTSNVNDMEKTFEACYQLMSLDVSNWNTDNVTNMFNMFYSCNNLTTLNTSNWNTSNVTNMSYMFYNCNNLTTLDVSKWNTSKVTNMSYMFADCHSLTILDVSKWNTDKVFSMRQMFANCQSLIKMDFSNWVIYGDNWDLFSFLGNCINLEEVVVGAWNIDHGLITQSMFYNCPKLKHIYGLGTWNTSGLASTYALFQKCSSLVELDISNWDLSAVTNWNGMLLDMDSLKYIKCNNINTINILASHLPVNSTQGTIVCKQRDLSDLDMVTLNSKNWTVTNEPILIAKYVFDKSIYNNTIPTFNTEFEGYFIEDVEIEGNEVTRVIESCGMLPTLMRFGTSSDSDNRSLSFLKILYINAIELTTMYTMFRRCRNLISVHNVDKVTNKVLNMWAMFADCNNLEYVDVSDWDVTRVNTLNYAFSNCYKLVNIDVSKWDTSNITTTYYLFYSCRELTKLDLSNWNTSNILNMGYMFASSTKLEMLDISNFDMTNVTDTIDMFYNTPKLTDIGMLNCNKSTIQKVVDLLPTNINRTIWYNEANVEGITVPSHVKLREYKEENVEIVLNSPLLEGDTIEMVDGNLCHVHKMGKIVLNGSEDWKMRSNSEGYCRTYLTRDDLKLNPNMICNTINSWVKPDGLGLTSTLEGISGHKTVQEFRLYLLNTRLTTSDVMGIKQWLSENPTTVVYELAEPWYENITPLQSELTLKTLEECSMEIITNLPVKTNITYRTNITSAYELERQVNSVDTSGVSLANLIEEEVDE